MTKQFAMSNSPDPDSLHLWARQTIGLNGDPDPSQLRVDVLRCLKSSNFPLTDDWDGAIDVLLASSQHSKRVLPLDYYQSRERELRIEVGQFTEVFFELAAAVRRERWLDLSRQCVIWPPLRQWLQQIEPGLDIERRFDDMTPEALREFGDLVCRYFLQPPGSAKQELYYQLATYDPVANRRTTIAAEFRRHYPNLAKLSPEVVNELADVAQNQRRELIAKYWRRFVMDRIPGVNGTPILSGQLACILGPLLAVVVTLIRMTASNVEPAQSFPRVRNYSVPEFPKLALTHKINLRPPEIDQTKAFLARLAEEQRMYESAAEVTRILIGAGALVVEKNAAAPVKSSTSLVPQGQTAGDNVGPGEESPNLPSTVKEAH